MSKQHATHETGAGPERALLVGVEVTDTPDAWPLEDSLAELARLAETAGLAVTGTLTQRLRRPSPRTVLGPGKVEELAARCAEQNIDLVVFDDELSPGQARNLEDALSTRVIDRTGLILDIFAQHAHTREGRIQVGLAQYSYLLTRLRSLKPGRPARGGSAGGVGLRGPGETQLEQDRRAVMRRVTELRAELEDVRRHRELYREQRRQGGVPVVALVGYTNAGKSTLLNALTQAGVRAEDRLFATLDPVTRELALPGGQELLLTDTVGFIRKLPPQLVAAFRATLEEIAEADLVLHVLDASHPAVVEQSQTVLETLVQLRAANRPRLTVLNKVDQLDDPAAEVPALAHELGLSGGYVAISAREGRGLDQLLEAIRDELQGRMAALEAVIPYEHGELAALWHQHGVVEREDHEEGGTRMVGRLPAALAARFAPFQVRRRRERAVGERGRQEG